MRNILIINKESSSLPSTSHQMLLPSPQKPKRRKNSFDDNIKYTVNFNFVLLLKFRTKAIKNILIKHRLIEFRKSGTNSTIIIEITETTGEMSNKLMQYSI